MSIVLVKVLLFDDLLHPVCLQHVVLYTPKAEEIFVKLHQKIISKIETSEVHLGFGCLHEKINL